MRLLADADEPCPSRINNVECFRTFRATFFIFVWFVPRWPRRTRLLVSESECSSVDEDDVAVRRDDKHRLEPFHSRTQRFRYKQKYQIAKFPKAAQLAEEYAASKQTREQLLQQEPSAEEEPAAGQSSVISHQLTLSQRIMQELALARKPKAEYITARRYNQFVVPLPSKRLSAYDVSVMKLVAQFTTCSAASPTTSSSASCRPCTRASSTSSASSTPTRPWWTASRSIRPASATGIASLATCGGASRR